LIRESGCDAFPPRLPSQPFFYPVLKMDYAVEIAQRWNTRDGDVGYITRFRVRAEYLRRHSVRTVGGSIHKEYWIPADDLAELNRNIVGRIEVIAGFRSGAATSQERPNV
jgi:hypothetical protein